MTDQELANLIRRYCDGELDEREAASFEERLSTDERLRRQVAFELRLRDGVKAALSNVKVPPSLEARIRDSFAKAGAAAVPGSATPKIAAAGPPGRARTEDRRRRFTAAHRANLLALAATLALIAGAVLFSIFVPQIDELGRGRNVVLETANWLSAEHVRCLAAPDQLAGQLEWPALDEARDGLTEHLGWPARIADLSPLGYRFLGAGRCMVPSAEVSGHVLYRRDDGAEMVSIFVVPIESLHPEFELPAGTQGTWTDLPVRPGRAPVRCFDAGGLLYFVVCGNDDREPVESAIHRAAREGGSGTPHGSDPSVP